MGAENHDKLHEDDVDDEECEKPTKYISTDVFLSVKCRLQYFDFEATSDLRSIKNIVTKLNPHKIVRELYISFVFYLFIYLFFNIDFDQFRKEFDPSSEKFL